MNDSDPPGSSLYRGPAGKPRDKRERAQDRRVQEQRGEDQRGHERRSAGPHRAGVARSEDRGRIEAGGRRGGDRASTSSDRSHAGGMQQREVRAPRDAQAREAAGDRSHPRQATREVRTERLPTVQVAQPAALEPVAPREQRIYGLNACLALFAKRPQALRKVWLLESRIPRLKLVLAHCARNRLGYTLVEAEDLERLSGSAHHEGVVFGAMEAEELSLSAWLRDLPRGPALAIWLDGVGNPHNLGAILRSAAHFGVAGVLLPKHSELALSGAAARVAEGGAEQVPMVRLGRPDNAIAQLGSAGFTLAATVVRGGKSLYATALPERLVLVMGAEQIGVTDEIGKAAGLRLGIPGTGKVESLNVAAATAAMLGEWWRQQRA